jgi:hypothetical protein
MDGCSRSFLCEPNHTVQNVLQERFASPDSVVVFACHVKLGE